MKFCSNCGRPLQDGEVCNCQNGNNNIYPTSIMQNNSKAVSKGFMVMGAGLLTGIVIIVLVFSSLFGGYKKPVKDYVKALNHYDTKKMLSVMLPDSKMKEIKKEMKDSIIDWDAFLDKMDDALEETMEELEDDYGKNVKVSAKIVNKKKVKGDDLEEIQEDYDDAYDAEVTKAYKLKVEMTVKGKKDEDTEKVSLYVVKVKGDGWKMYDFDDDLDIGIGDIFGSYLL